MKNNRSSFGLLRWMLPVLLLAMIFAFTASPPAQAAPPVTAELSTFTLPDGGFLLAQIDAPATNAITYENTTTDTGAVTAPESPTVTWLQILTPIVTPLLIAGIKLGIPKIPSLWLPLLAGAFGAVGSLIDHYALGASLNLWLGVGLGLAGVGVREATKQLKQATAPAAAA